MKPISSITKVDLARHAILQMIFSGALSPGQRLVEARLAADLGVAQATINSALQTLHDQAIVCKVLNTSTRVSRYSYAEIENLFSVRSILEPAAAVAASRNLDAQGVEVLEREASAMLDAAKASDLPRFCLADYTFHQEIYRLSRNPVLIQACQSIAAAPFAYILCDCPSLLPTDYVSLAEDHFAVIRALEEGPEAAAAFTRDRIEAWKMHSILALNSVATQNAEGACA
jgi:DNA-binding GntR family transcriptional regulator